MRKLTFAAFGLFAFAFNSNAQSTATATATATVISPISITKNADMSFGNIAVNGTSGTVVLAPAGTRTSTSGVTLPSTTGTVTAAAFTVTGSGSLSYAITLPNSAVTLTHSGGVQTMTADNFTSNPATTGTLSSGTQNITVGATLNVTGGQLAGVYTSGNFTVTVNYN